MASVLRGQVHPRPCLGLTDLLRDEVTRIARIEVHKPPLGGG
ncbi:hypothetical protein [Xanthomonas translucens]|nr:hypothetical protein [Xanthomonas translucens]